MVSSSCTPKNMRVRREWYVIPDPVLKPNYHPRGAMPKPERKAYTDVVLCLQRQPSIFPLCLYPSAKTRYDDFVLTHIHMTLNIHLDGLFLSWHRNFVHLYELALRVECGYQGATPYWDWAKYSSNLTTSPFFDGTEHSLSGNGLPQDLDVPYVLGENTSVPHGMGWVRHHGPVEGLHGELGAIFLRAGLRRGRHGPPSQLLRLKSPLLPARFESLCAGDISQPEHGGSTPRDGDDR